MNSGQPQVQALPPSSRPKTSNALVAVLAVLAAVAAIFAGLTYYEYSQSMNNLTTATNDQSTITNQHNAFSQQLASDNATIASDNAQILADDAKITALEASGSSDNATIASLQSQVTTLQGEVASLDAQVASLDDIVTLSDVDVVFSDYTINIAADSGLYWDLSGGYSGYVYVYWTASQSATYETVAQTFDSNSWTITSPSGSIQDGYPTPVVPGGYTFTFWNGALLSGDTVTFTLEYVY